MERILGEDTFRHLFSFQSIKRTGFFAVFNRIDDDEYGYCRECDEPINPKRLEFDPTVLLCIECASKAEQA